MFVWRRKTSRCQLQPFWAGDTGREEDVNACAACHGVSGTGDGPMVEFMSVKVPDLSLLAARNDGDFPMLDVIQTIDGRTGVRLRGHGPTCEPRGFENRRQYLGGQPGH
ncbi:c-type cytochrome [uncultured Boseongicola sp.]|uniref:c-type cytochrome n=1 Tax=uncultured Boseongicola sp. TaxID=1648499 RepID=UPI003443A0D6